MHSLERVIGVFGDVTEIRADMRVPVPDRNLDGGAPLRTTQVNNLNFLMRVGEDVMGDAAGLSHRMVRNRLDLSGVWHRRHANREGRR